MPCHYEIFEDLHLVKITFDGVLATRDVLNVVDKLDSDPLYTPTIDELGDFRTLSEIAFDADTIQNLNDLLFGMYIRSNRTKRIAQIAPYEPGLIIARAFATVMQQNPKLEVGIFDSPGPAIEFLGHSTSIHAPKLGRQMPEAALRPE